MPMKLISFHVQSFRSVADSGTIATEQVTALIGTNEAGKTNLLLPLWKLNPAKDGEINLTSDTPRKRFSEIRAQQSKPKFISAYFELDDGLVEQLVGLTGATPDQVRVAKVERSFDGSLYVGFPNGREGSPQRDLPADRVIQFFGTGESSLAQVSPLKSEEKLLKDVLRAVTEARARALGESGAGIEGRVSDDALQAAQAELKKVNVEDAAKTSELVPAFQHLVAELEALLAEVSKEHPQSNKEALTLVVGQMPKFVYYSNYGNLDSEIYLPHVIENMNRTGLGAKEAAKARTLKVLFEFVRLSPQEILELGRDFKPPPSQPALQPNEAQIRAIAEKKKQRSILLQSASAQLTEKFREWWKQGEYRFRFEADGDHFRIWVSDDKRPEEVELEGRSTGLQWFLSFYLVFLVESQDAHEGAVLLLDEPGLSLHPIGQRDLSAFFDNLSETNQILYTTHLSWAGVMDRSGVTQAVRSWVGQADQAWVGQADRIE
ncbi:hypothetical protein EJ065_2784 [Corallococcus coralloides]|uniref:Endonuclease GajA/Old nuclease/RecF-like AAA domain-containing protein n=1 Tax=Corallococcus coralloides TaxID=184914 RepID=A0A410RR44_CORCK|nr:AAA family ATPase [Corallococcus coralloides]QAT84356.1 hypothetical protein EJ065_2784 [Corallococcus coralloides]